MYVGRCELPLPTSGTRDPNLRDHLSSFARCPRVETDLAAAVLSPVLNLDQPILSYHIISHPVLSCPVVSCPILSYPILSYRVLSCPVLSDHPHDFATRQGHTTGARAQGPSRSCTCAKALTETHPGVRDWLSPTRICMQSKLGTPSRPLFGKAGRSRRSCSSQWCCCWWHVGRPTKSLAQTCC
jgi:hypothetical protein